MPRFLLILFILAGLAGCSPNKKSENNSEISQKDTVNVINQDSADTGIPLQDFETLVQKYEDPERVNWQNPEMVLEKMGNLIGKKVADIGVGTGYFAFRIIRKGATVIGVDIEQRFIDYIEERKADLPKELADRIITRLTQPNDPALKPGEVDWVLIVNTFYILDNRISYLNKVRKGLKPNGKLLIVDFKMGDIPVGPEDSRKVSLSEAVREIKTTGFKILETDDKSLQYQYIIVAQK